MSALRFDGVGLRLGSTQALHDIGLEIGSGWTAIVGPNGAGKSTLLRVAAGLLASDRGQARLDGIDLATMPPAERARRIAWLSQQGESASELSVRDVVRLGRLPHSGLFGPAAIDDEVRIDAAMQDAGCAPWPERRLDQLSGGERQRVHLARALAVGAPWLLLDEPTAHLDPAHQIAIVALLQRLAGAGTAVVSVLHDLSLALLADRVVVMRAGRIAAAGGRDDVAMQQALIEVFDGAVRIERFAERWLVLPRLP